MARRYGARGAERPTRLRADPREVRTPADPDPRPQHTFASLLLQQGESIVYVKEQLGHASIQITVDTYGHLFRARIVRPSPSWTTRRHNHLQPPRNRKPFQPINAIGVSRLE
jgi:hypothetical protein